MRRATQPPKERKPDELIAPLWKGFARARVTLRTCDLQQEQQGGEAGR
jgi:hypothetical protein